jgi:hypothetical protein
MDAHTPFIPKGLVSNALVNVTHMLHKRCAWLERDGACTAYRLLSLTWAACTSWLGYLQPTKALVGYSLAELHP